MFLSWSLGLRRRGGVAVASQAVAHHRSVSRPLAAVVRLGRRTPRAALAQRALGGPLLPLRKRARVAMRDIVDTFDRLVPTGDLHTGDEATSEERATGDL